MTELCGSHTRIAIWNGDGMGRNVRAVGRGQVDIAVSTPAAFVAAAVHGRGPYADESFPHLRAFGVVPQQDRLVFAIHKDLGISNFEDLRQSKPALIVATGANDGNHHVGTAVHELLARTSVDVRGWGGTLLEDQSPFQSLDRVRAREANAIIHEAVMVPGWQEIGPDMTFLPLEQDVLNGLRSDLFWPDAVVPGGYFPGAPEFRTLDFSDFLVYGRADLPDDIAYALAWVLVETRQGFEAQYHHIPAERSPVTYPLDPMAMSRTPIPLHPGAAAYYKAALLTRDV
ncbi:TAXI family TRAP transporter solute-binding subunit [Nocardia sp. NPDC052278]|uniref:TAXI family TRAP transporter solute-binding subunit n=1 Tax=unclassified Nocardia TaxID=2637762 RepID=UPI0036B9390D